jgi:hypothetical protein
MTGDTVLSENQSMKTAILLIVIGALSFFALSRDLIGNIRDEFRRDRTTLSKAERENAERTKQTSSLDLNGIETLVLETFNGDIVVQNGNAQQNSITIERFGQIIAPIERNGNELIVRSRAINGRSCDQCGASLTLQIDRAVDLQVEVVTGNFKSTGQINSIRASSVTGDITVENAGNTNLELEATTGHITVSGTDGAMRLVNVTGRTRVANGTIGTLSIEATTAPVTLENLKFENTQSANQLELVSSRLELRQVTDAQFEIDAITSDMLWDDVTLRPGSSNRIQSVTGGLEWRKFAAERGLDISGTIVTGGFTSTIPGFNIQMSDDTIQASQPGSNPAKLEMDIITGSVTLKP